MKRILRVFLSGFLLLALAIVPAGCSSMPANVPVTIPTLGAPPPMTGNLVADSSGGGWTGALQINLGTSTYALVCRATDPVLGVDFVYLGISCSDFAPTPATRVVLDVGAPTIGPTCTWKVHFTPFPLGGAQQIAGDSFWRNMATWNAPGGSVVQPVGLGWPLPNSWGWAQGGGSPLWTFETKIYVNPANNNNGIMFPAPGTIFSVYLNVLNNGNAGLPGNLQYPWPSTTLMSGAIDTHTPSVGLWAQAMF